MPRRPARSNQPPRHRLRVREEEIMDRFDAGMTAAEIAAALGIGINRVRKVIYGLEDDDHDRKQIARAAAQLLATLRQVTQWENPHALPDLRTKAVPARR